MRARFTILMAAATCLFAQHQGPPMGHGHMAPNFDAIKTYLNLTDSQTQALQNIQQQDQEATRSAMRKMRQSQAMLDNLMQKGGADPATVGKLMLDIQEAQGSVSKAHGAFNAQAVNNLTEEQKTKLKTLQDALQLMPAIHQAMGLQLLGPPQEPSGAAAESRFHRGPGRRGPPPPPSN
jgi:Spy/CpxP family protein refolding chaperone